MAGQCGPNLFMVVQAHTSWSNTAQCYLPAKCVSKKKKRYVSKGVLHQLSWPRGDCSDVSIKIKTPWAFYWQNDCFVAIWNTWWCTVIEGLPSTLASGTLPSTLKCASMLYKLVRSTFNSILRMHVFLWMSCVIWIGTSFSPAMSVTTLVLSEEHTPTGWNNVAAWQPWLTLLDFQLSSSPIVLLTRTCKLNLPG